MAGDADPAVVGAFLAAMRMKGATGDELCGFAERMRAHAVRHDFGAGGLVDTCGTGGGRPTFNLSTAAAILASAAGAKVAKHGNRAVTSKCGSADVLSALGVPIEGSAEELGRRIEVFGMAFLFAPSHHPAMRHVGPVRRALGFQTFFNLLGPLSNPAGAMRQMVGVSLESAVGPVAEALMKLGTERSFVVRGEDGLDEVSPVAATEYHEVRDGGVEVGRWVPGDFGVSGLTEADLAQGETLEENAEILRQALSPGGGNRTEAVVPNASVALVLGGRAGSVAEAAALARECVRSGAALAHLEALVADR